MTGKYIKKLKTDAPDGWDLANPPIKAAVCIRGTEPSMYWLKINLTQLIRSSCGMVSVDVEQRYAPEPVLRVCNIVCKAILTEIPRRKW